MASGFFIGVEGFGVCGGVEVWGLRVLGFSRD